MSDNEFTDDSVSKLSAFLKDSNTLKILELADCEIIENYMKDLALAIENQNKLVNLNLSYNSIGTGLSGLAKAFRNNNTLKALNLKGNAMDENLEDFKNLIPVFKIHPAIEYIEIAVCDIEENHIKELAKLAARIEVMQGRKIEFCFERSYSNLFDESLQHEKSILGKINHRPSIGLNK